MSIDRQMDTEDVYHFFLDSAYKRYHMIFVFI